jgi:hypothetical protein
MSRGIITKIRSDDPYPDLVYKVLDVKNAEHGSHLHKNVFI